MRKSQTRREMGTENLGSLNFVRWPDYHDVVGWPFLFGRMQLWQTDKTDSC